MSSLETNTALGRPNCFHAAMKLPSWSKIWTRLLLRSDNKGHVKAYVVSVGGILGIGAKEVAFEQSAFHEMPVIEGRPQEKQFVVPRLQVSMTKDQLKQMEEFKALPRQPDR